MKQIMNIRIDNLMRTKLLYTLNFIDHSNIYSYERLKYCRSFYGHWASRFIMTMELES